MKEQIYQDKINNLKKQLQQLSEGNHPEWLKRIKRLDNQLKERLFINTVVKELELEMAEQDFLLEKKNVVKEFEEKKVYLKEQLPGAGDGGAGLPHREEECGQGVR